MDKNGFEETKNVKIKLSVKEKNQLNLNQDRNG